MRKTHNMHHKRNFISYLPNKVEIIISGDMPIIKGTRKTDNIDHKRKVQLSFQKKCKNNNFWLLANY